MTGMIAVDTNVVVRLIVADHEDQLEAVRRLMSRSELLVPLTVLLETAWVLRSRYGYDREALTDALDALARLDGIRFEEPTWVDWAIARHRSGGDIAGGLHLVAARRAAAFATFDRDLAARAGADPPLPIETLT
jgi:predicted nucleic acid-binding protein